jgi:hypothetical protein
MELDHPHGYATIRLVTATGHDAYKIGSPFHWKAIFYGRSISASASPPHRFLPGSKGGLYSWEQVRRLPEVTLIEGLFDYAVLWQAGFHKCTRQFLGIFRKEISAQAAYTAPRSPM